MISLRMSHACRTLAAGDGAGEANRGLLQRDRRRETPSPATDRMRRAADRVALGGALVVTLDNGANPVVALRNRLPLGSPQAPASCPVCRRRDLRPRRFRRLLVEADFAVLETRVVMIVRAPPGDRRRAAAPAPPGRARAFSRSRWFRGARAAADAFRQGLFVAARCTSYA